MPVGIVGRYVMYGVARGEGAERRVVEEPCEIVACQTAGEYGSWRVLVASSDGYILQTGVEGLRLVPAPGSDGGPYR